MYTSLESILEDEALSPGDFVGQLQHYAETSYATNHPLLKALASGEFEDMRGTIARFLTEYYYYSHRFTRYLGALIAALDRPEHRAVLVENIAEETGIIDEDHEEELREAGINPEDVKFPHPDLFRRFLRSIGLDPHEMIHREAHIVTVAWSQTFLDICLHGGEPQAVGALGIGTEGIVRHMYQQILAGIRIAWPEMTARDRAFFDLHAVMDDDHANTLRKIATKLAETRHGRRELAIGTVKAINARAVFFDHMLAYLHRTDAHSRQIKHEIAPDPAISLPVPVA